MLTTNLVKSSRGAKYKAKYQYMKGDGDKGYEWEDMSSWTTKFNR